MAERSGRAGFCDRFCDNVCRKTGFDTGMCYYRIMEEMPTCGRPGVSRAGVLPMLRRLW
jgi:hypothetical protein